MILSTAANEKERKEFLNLILDLPFEVLHFAAGVIQILPQEKKTQSVCPKLIDRIPSPLGQDEFLIGPMKGNGGTGFSISLHEPQSMKAR